MLGFAPISSVALSSIPGFYSFSGTLECALTATDSNAFKLFAASQYFITRASDDPPNQPFDGTLITPINFQRSIVGQNGYGELSVGVGSMKLVNAEGDYDAIVDENAIDGRRVILWVGGKAGSVVDPFANFVTVADLTATGWTLTEDSLEVQVRDDSFKLEQNPVPR